MKKLIVFVILFFISLNVYAVDVPACTDSEMTRLKEIANNVKFKTNYEIIEASEENHEIEVFYNIEIVNFDKNLKIHYTSKYDTEEEIIKSNTSKISNMLDGDSVTFKIYSYTTNLCTDEILKTVTVKLPSVNPYYYFNKEKCDNNPNFKYCKEFMDFDADFDTIDKEFEEFLNPSNNNSSGSNEHNNKNNVILWVISGVVLIILVSITTFIIIKKKKNDDL